MSEYAKVKVGRLVLKGESATSSSSSKRKHKKHKRDKAEKPSDDASASATSSSSSKRRRRGAVVDEDAIAHGGWWSATKFEHITGSVALQFGPRTYVTALDNGLFTLGAPHAVGEPPAPEEIFTALPVSETRVAFKSGYGKYLNVDTRTGMVAGRSDAVGATEQFEPVWEEGRLALQAAANSCFVAVDPEDDALVALRKQAGAAEVLLVRSCAERETGAKDDAPVEEKGDLSQVEINYM